MGNDLTRTLETLTVGNYNQFCSPINNDPRAIRDAILETNHINGIVSVNSAEMTLAGYGYQINIAGVTPNVRKLFEAFVTAVALEDTFEEHLQIYYPHYSADDGELASYTKILVPTHLIKDFQKNLITLFTKSEYCIGDAQPLMYSTLSPAEFKRAGDVTQNCFKLLKLLRINIPSLNRDFITALINLGDIGTFGEVNNDGKHALMVKFNEVLLADPATRPFMRITSFVYSK